ncbi:hypothetical protein PL321_11400 [Caloramator sp. mosi_1]|jgi:hypothetical protein|nr:MULTISPECIES: hypothetical protein [Caloramator]WDC83361.1 hypothetical protein PL321_11400 [Caloramator sp. mosi_1]
MNNINNLQQITVVYNVTVTDIKDGQALDTLIVDLYIGVSPNSL